MASETPFSLEHLATLLAWIEAHLDEAIDLDRIARKAGLSAFHFSRIFSAVMGRSVMAHVRGRKLVRAAHRLVDDPNVRLIDLAFDCGFESQEAFTRAFRRLFGVAPGRFRKGFVVTPIAGQFPMTMPETIAANVVQLPALVPLNAFTVVGPARRFTEANKAAIPQLWSQLIGALPLRGQSPDGNSYGIIHDVDRAEGSFRYMAAVGVDMDALPPDGFDRLSIPAATYVIFRITLNGGAVHLQIKAAMAKIWGEMVPASGLTIAEGPDFELQEPGFDPMRIGATIDFHVPVVG